MVIHLITLNVDERKLQRKNRQSQKYSKEESFKTPLRTNRQKWNKDNGRLEQHFNPALTGLNKLLNNIRIHIHFSTNRIFAK